MVYVCRKLVYINKKKIIWVFGGLIDRNNQLIKQLIDNYYIILYDRLWVLLDIFMYQKEFCLIRY